MTEYSPNWEIRGSGDYTNLMVTCCQPSSEFTCIFANTNRLWVEVQTVNENLHEAEETELNYLGTKGWPATNRSGSNTKKARSQHPKSNISIYRAKYAHKTEDSLKEMRKQKSNLVKAKRYKSRNWLKNRKHQPHKEEKRRITKWSNIRQKLDKLLDRLR